MLDIGQGDECDVKTRVMPAESDYMINERMDHEIPHIWH